MTTFQAVIYSVLQGFSEFLPISAEAHRRILSSVVGWPEPAGAFMGALYLGSLLALLLFFLHDWASLASSLIQVIVYRRKPMTLDERLPLFLILATLPLACAWFYLGEQTSHWEWTLPMLAAVLAGAALPLWFLENWSRKNKAIYDWNSLDSLIVGILQSLMLVPGYGRMTGALTGAMARNYNREAAAKFAFLAGMPVLAVATFVQLREIPGAGLGEGMSWLTFFVTVVVTCLSGLLAIGGFMKHIQRRGFAQYAIYRLVLAIAVIGVWWYRSRGEAG